MAARQLIARDDLDAGRVDLSEEGGGERLPPVHPGDVLRHDFLDPLGLTPHALALALRVPPNRITAILPGSAPSRRNPPSVWPVISAPVRASGLTCKNPMSWNRPSARRAHASAPRSRRATCPAPPARDGGRNPALTATGDSLHHG